MCLFRWQSFYVYMGAKYVLCTTVLLLEVFHYFCLADLDILYRKDVCEEKEFFIPYVRLLRTRQPHHENMPILKLLSPGFIDVSMHSGILCINGPAIVYSDITQDQRPSCAGDKSTIPSQGEPRNFNHDCFSINRQALSVYKDRNQPQGLQKDTKVFGNKVFGVYLVGLGPDYRVSNFAFFPRADFGFRPIQAWCIHDGASVAFVADSVETSTHCYSVKKYNMEGAVVAAFSGNPVFCYREDQDSDFDTPWHKENEKPLDSPQISWDEDLIQPCDPGTQSKLPSKESEVEPFQLPDFRIIHPKFWSSQGSRAVMWKAKRKLDGEEGASVFSKPNPPGSLFAGEPGWQDPSLLTHSGELVNGDRDFDDDNLTIPYRKTFAEILDCEDLPYPEENCKESEIPEPCVFINHVLTLEKVDWKSDNLKEGSWRLPIIKLIDGIYETACPQVAKFLPSSLSRLFQYYLDKALQAEADLATKFKEPQKNEWGEMIADLEQCYQKATPMIFYRKRNIPAVKLKIKLEVKLAQLYETVSKRRSQPTLLLSRNATVDFDVYDEEMKAANKTLAAELLEIENIKSHLNERPIKFPYQILIGTAAKSGVEVAEKVFQYREAAEVDHELDWAIDAYWKVVSTVFGYCNLHYASREASTFMRLYDSFTRDFMDYVATLWIKPDNRPVYERLFGEFFNGPGSIWLDACQNGAYQWSEQVALRPLRPLTLLEGEVPPLPDTGNPDNKKANGPPNFFLDNPLYNRFIDDSFNCDGCDTNDIPVPNQNTEAVPKDGGNPDPKIKPPIMQKLETTDPLHPSIANNSFSN